MISRLRFLNGPFWFLSGNRFWFYERRQLPLYRAYCRGFGGRGYYNGEIVPPERWVGFSCPGQIGSISACRLASSLWDGAGYLGLPYCPNYGWFLMTIRIFVTTVELKSRRKQPVKAVSFSKLQLSHHKLMVMTTVQIAPVTSGMMNWCTNDYSSKFEHFCQKTLLFGWWQPFWGA